MPGNVLNCVENVRKGASVLAGDQVILNLSQDLHLLTAPVQQEHMTSMFYITFNSCHLLSLA